MGEFLLLGKDTCAAEEEHSRCCRRPGDDHTGVQERALHNPVDSGDGASEAWNTEDVHGTYHAMEGQWNIHTTEELHKEDRAVHRPSFANDTPWGHVAADSDLEEEEEADVLDSGPL